MTEPIREVLQAYVDFRTAVLGLLAPSLLTKAAFVRLTHLSPLAQRSRQLNPNLWQPAEIDRLAYQVGLADPPASRLAPLAERLACLPGPQQRALLGVSRLTPPQLAARRQDPSLWQAAEITRLAAHLTGPVGRLPAEG